MKTAHGLGMAVIVVLTLSGAINWFIHHFVTAPYALSWLSVVGLDAGQIDVSFLEFLLFISVIAAMTQIAEIIIDYSSQWLYRSLGIYIPLIAVNCAILGASLFVVIRGYPLIPAVVYLFASGVGWWVAITLLAAIREKLSYAQPPEAMKGPAILFIMTGLMALAFMGFSGMRLTGNLLERFDEDIPLQTACYNEPFCCDES